LREVRTSELGPGDRPGVGDERAGRVRAAVQAQAQAEPEAALR
jgi:hypothetical protein